MGNKINFNEIIVLDLESTCEEGGQRRENTEIIEIGGCILNIKTLDISNKFSYIIKPTKYKISRYCTNLTGITQEDVDDGISLREALDDMKETYKIRKRPFSAWGDYDRDMLQLECEAKGIKYPFSSAFINIKALFPILFQLKESCGVKGALDLLNLKFEGQEHSGCDDAYNTAKIFVKMLEGGLLPTQQENYFKSHPDKLEVYTKRSPSGGLNR